MPHHKSTAKRHKQDKVRRVRNRSAKARLRTAIKKALNLAAGGNKEEAEAAFRSACSVIDKTAKKNVIPKNRASRKKSQLARVLKSVE